MKKQNLDQGLLNSDRNKFISQKFILKSKSKPPDYFED